MRDLEMKPSSIKESLSMANNRIVHFEIPAQQPEQAAKPE